MSAIRRQAQPDVKLRRARRSNSDVLSALKRLVRAYSRREGTDVLAGLAELAADVDAAMLDSVTWLRSADGGAHSWAEIGSALGISRQSAQERFRKAGGVRSPGGQPSRLR